MLSRIADALFWTARYMERAEDTARILDVNYHMLLEGARDPCRVRWEPLIVIAGERERFFACYDGDARERLGVPRFPHRQPQLDRRLRDAGA